MKTAASRLGSSPSEQMEGMLAGHFVAKCLHTAAVLGIADLLVKGPTTIEVLATATGCDELSLHRLLRTLASVGVFTEPTPGCFQLAPLGETLRSDAPDSLRDKAIFEISAPIWLAWGSLLDALRSGAPSFPQLHHATIYEYLAEHAQLGAVFNRFMTAQSNLHNAAIADAYDFSGVRMLVDVGGGHGATLTAVLRRYPTMKGVLFDLPEVVATARFEGPDLAGRCDVVGGNMLQSVPAGGDAYVIKRVMMDKTDADAVIVLRNCLTAMNAAGRILVVDPMLPANAEPHPNWLTDMLMLVMTRGRCRTEAEFRHLFDAAGLTLARIIATRSPNFILESICGGR
jgi:O-methyltransferase domain